MFKDMIHIHEKMTGYGKCYVLIVNHTRTRDSNLFTPSVKIMG